MMYGIASIFGVAVGVVLAALCVRAIMKQAEKNRSDVPQVKMAKTVSPKLMLVCESGPLAGESWKLSEDSMEIGRDDGCAVRYPRDTRSILPVHCRVRRTAGGLEVTAIGAVDLADGSPLDGTAVLGLGEPFLLGEKHHRYVMRLEE